MTAPLVAMLHHLRGTIPVPSLAPGKGKGVLAVLLAVGVIAGSVGACAQSRPADRQDASRPPADPKAEGDRARQSQPAAEKPKPRRDFHGDPLPDGAIARIGTVRLRHPPLPQLLAFTPDGKSLVSQSAGSVRVWDVGTGRERFQIARPNTHFIKENVAISPDGKLLAVNLSEQLHLWDLRTEKEVPVPIAPGSIYRAVFFPDSRRMLTVTLVRPGWRLACWDLEQKKRLYEAALGEVGGGVAISPDGKTLAFSGGEIVRLWDVATRKDRHRMHVNSGARDLLFTRDGKILATAAHDGVIYLWDRKTGKEVGQLKGHKGTVYSLAALPDGKRLASGGHDGTLRLWDLARAREVRCLASHSPEVWGVAISPDGSLLASAGGDGVIRLWEAGTGKEHVPFRGPSASPWWVCFGPDGKTLATVGWDHIGIWDARTGAPKALFEDHVDEYGLALSRDGKRLATWSYRTQAVHVYELPSLEEVRRSEKGWVPPRAAFSPDGKALAVAQLGAIHFLDLTGKEKTRHIPTPAKQTIVHLAFSPDGKILFLTGGGTPGESVYSLDAGTGKERWHAGPLGATLYHLDVSPDGRLVAAAGDKGLIVLYDSATGKEVRRCLGSSTLVFALIFSPDGRMLATGCLDKTLRLWEVATGQERRCIKDFPSEVDRLSFSPDGRLLASCWLAGSTVLVWDLMSPTKDPASAIRLDARGLEASWQDLAGSDAARAYQAVLTLARAPTRAVPFLAEHLRPVRAADAARLEPLLERLDSSDFSARQKAAKELEQLGFAAEPGLRIALAAGPELEARRRIERVLGKLEGAPTLQVVRAIEALELAGTPEARKLLETLATGAAEARPTREAQATLERLRRRAAVAP